MSAPSIRHAGALLALSLAAALTACGENPAAQQREEPAVCRTILTVSPPFIVNPLFTVLEAPVLTAQQAQTLATAQAEPTAASVHVARLAANAAELLQPGRELSLPVSPTRTFSVAGVSVLSGTPDHVVFTGRTNEPQGDVYLVLSPLGVTGTLQAVSTREVYSFRPLGGGLHAITCVDPSKFGRD